MTAIVGILNRHAVAVAADSAETIGSGVKIYNKANKIFALSKYNPVGIAIYSNANFNSCIPWETVIKLYRKQLGKKFFSTLKEYEENFYAYVNDFRSKYLETRDMERTFLRNIYEFWRTVIFNELKKSDPINGLIHPDDLQNLNGVLNQLNSLATNNKVIANFSGISKDKFEEAIAPVSRTIYRQIQNAGGNLNDYKELIISTFYNVFTRKIDIMIPYTGIAFFGFGEDEVLPNLYRTQVYDAAFDILYWEELSQSKIDNTNNGSAICPMAQTDVIRSYIEGISPDVEQTFVASTMQTIGNVITTISNQLNVINPLLAQAVSNIDLKQVANQYMKRLSDFKRKSIVQPLMDTVATMEKEDLAELAENLIYLTSLKRRITPNLESVGGPIDVAVISKGDGFIWIKRKHYFNPRLNHSYFDNYLNDIDTLDKDITSDIQQ